MTNAKSALNLRLPVMRPVRFVPTEQTRKIAQLTVAAIPDGGLVAWTGREGVGKTSAARNLTTAINAGFSETNEQTFRAHYFQTGRIRESKSDDRQALRVLYGQIIGAPLVDYQYRSRPQDAIVKEILLTLQRKRIRLVSVDEAGMLSLGAMQAYVLVRDAAEENDWRMSFLFIGMEDLLVTLNEPKIRRRIHRWCPFEEYDFEQTKRILTGIHPHFTGPWTRTLEEEATYIQEVCGGYPGNIIFFLGRVDEMVNDLGGEFDLRAMKASQEYAVGDERKALEILQHYNKRASNSQKNDALKSRGHGSKTAGVG